MSHTLRLPRLAVLIDGENISPDVADGLFVEIAKLGEARLRRIYGNFSRPRLASWDAPIKKHSIKRVDLPDHVRGKNTSDIALVVDAMDLFHIGQFDGFCLVSSDSDFTRLAARLSNRGVDVYGFGARKTPHVFQLACHTFTHTEPMRARPKAPNSEKAVKSLPCKSVNDAIALLKDALSQMKNGNQWVELASVGKQLLERDPQFKPATYGVKKLHDLVSRTGAFDVEHSGSRIRIRDRSAYGLAKVE